MKETFDVGCCSAIVSVVCAGAVRCGAADRYMYARAGHSTLLTAIYDHNSTHCLQYRRHMRSRTAGHLVVFYQQTNLLNVPPSFVTLTHTVRLFEISKNQLDIWLVIFR